MKTNTPKTDDQIARHVLQEERQRLLKKLQRACLAYEKACKRVSIAFFDRDDVDIDDDDVYCELQLGRYTVNESTGVCTLDLIPSPELPTTFYDKTR